MARDFNFYKGDTIVSSIPNRINLMNRSGKLLFGHEFYDSVLKISQRLNVGVRVTKSGGNGFVRRSFFHNSDGNLVSEWGFADIARYEFPEDSDTVYIKCGTFDSKKNNVSAQKEYFLFSDEGKILLGPYERLNVLGYNVVIALVHEDEYVILDFEGNELVDRGSKRDRNRIVHYIVSGYGNLLCIERERDRKWNSNNEWEVYDIKTMDRLFADCRLVNARIKKESSTVNRYSDDFGKVFCDVVDKDSHLIPSKILYGENGFEIVHA